MIRRMNNNVLEICDENEELILSIAETIADGAMNVKVSGELRNGVAHDFEDEMMAALTVCKEINIDMSGVTYIAGMALRTLISMEQMLDNSEDAEMTIIKPSDAVKEMFNEHGFMDILRIEE